MKKETSLLILEEERFALPWPLGHATHAGQHHAQEENPRALGVPSGSLFLWPRKCFSQLLRLLPLPLKLSKLSRISQLWGLSFRGRRMRDFSSV